MWPANCLIIDRKAKHSKAVVNTLEIYNCGPYLKVLRFIAVQYYTLLLFKIYNSLLLYTNTHTNT